MKILIDPGHGGKDPGAVYKDIHESDIAFAIAEKVGVFLGKTGIGFELSRAWNEDPGQTARARKADEVKADALVSIHCNAAGSARAHGFEIITSPSGDRDKALAKTFAEYLTDATDIKPRKPAVKTDEQLGRGPGFRLTMLRAAKVPAVLIEVGFLTNKKDREILLSENGQNNIACAIALAIEQGRSSNMAKSKKSDLEKWSKIVEDKESKTDEIKKRISDLTEILKDGKIEPGELPRLLAITAETLRSVASLLTVLAVDPKISAVVLIIGGVLDKLADGIEREISKIVPAWAAIAGVMKDKEIDIKEIPVLLEAISNLLESAIAIALPFVSADFSGSAQALSAKLQKAVAFLNRFRPGKAEDKKTKKRPNVLV